MLSEAELSRMSRQERTRLARTLAAMDGPARAARPLGGWRRQLLIAFALIATVVLAAWTGFLAVTLPLHYRAGGWSAAWVGFDIILLLVFAATAWAAWRRRQVLILCLVVLGALLLCDAWFDTTLDYATRDFSASLLLAFLVEVPLAVMALIGARRLLRLTLGRIERLEGNHGPVPAFWKVPLFTEETAGSGYRDLFRSPDELTVTPEPDEHRSQRQEV
jgi:cation transport ATPase